MSKEFPIVTLCGSMRFYADMIRLAEFLTFDGWVVLMPFASKINILQKNQDGLEEKEKMLDRMHLEKIDMADVVLVVDRGLLDMFHTYIGESTTREIVYANDNEKPVAFFSLIGYDVDSPILPIELLQQVTGR